MTNSHSVNAINGYITMSEFRERVVPGVYNRSHLNKLAQHGVLPQAKRYGREYLIRVEDVQAAREAVLAHKNKIHELRHNHGVQLGRSTSRSQSLTLLTEIRDLLKQQVELMQKLWG